MTPGVGLLVVVTAAWPERPFFFLAGGVTTAFAFLGLRFAGEAAAFGGAAALRFPRVVTGMVNKEQQDVVTTKILFERILTKIMSVCCLNCVLFT